MISRRKLAGILFLFIVTGCILPGPWDYTPADKPTFRGILASVYAVADRPAQNVCFERVLDLDEGSTQAFPFYDSASVGIAGVFSTGGTTLLLNPLSNTPNCFTGAPGTHFLRNQSYVMTARFVWDSAGTRVISVLHATAHIPQSFHVSDTAVAPKLAQVGIAYASAADTSPQHVHTDFIQYHKGDSVFYIGGSSRLNNLSHYFHTVRSADINGVLVTQRYDTLNGGRPITSFDMILGLKPDTDQFYYPGNIRRLILDPNAPNPGGFNVLDSIGIVNVWFWSGLNRLYFYGVEKTYMDYNSTNVSDDNPKINPLTNVTGGRGFFAGMIVDSFDVFIKTDPTTKVYPYPATRAYTCRDKGWFESRDCSGWYHEFCSANEQRPDCHLDAVYTCLDPVKKASDTTGLCTAAQDYALDTALNQEATARYCIDHNYPANVPACAAVKSECVAGSSGNGCQLILWKSCELSYWKPAACVEGRRSYCLKYGETQRELCRDLD